jgi:hypothetical protein
MAFAKTKWPMKTRREEEVIIADGPQEQRICGPWGFGAGPGRNRADAGAQINGIQGFARVHNTTKRGVFVGEGKKNGLLPYEVDF